MKREHSEEVGPGLSGVKEELDQSSTRLRYSKRLMTKKKKIRRWITVGFLQIHFQLTFKLIRTGFVKHILQTLTHLNKYRISEVKIRRNT